MLRAAVLILLLANAGYFAWSQGMLRTWGLAPVRQAEPERVAQQLHPEGLRLQGGQPKAVAPAGDEKAREPAQAASAPASEPGAATTAAAPAGQCLQVGVFDERQTEALRASVAAFPEGSWAFDDAMIPGRWMVYMGRFADGDALDKKRAELRSRNVAFDRAGGTLEPGLSLGRFSTEEAAQRELGNLARQGVRTARVVQERTEAKGYILRLPAVTDALRPRLEALKPALGGRSLRSCG
jgi:hypothetical protein